MTFVTQRATNISGVQREDKKRLGKCNRVSKSTNCLRGLQPLEILLCHAILCVFRMCSIDRQPRSAKIYTGEITNISYSGVKKVLSTAYQLHMRVCSPLLQDGMC